MLTGPLSQDQERQGDLEAGRGMARIATETFMSLWATWWCGCRWRWWLPRVHVPGCAYQERR